MTTNEASYNAHSVSLSADYYAAQRDWRIWTTFAWNDLLSRYRGSWAGPLWIVLTATIFVGALSLVYGALFQVDIVDYMPVVAIGFSLWAFISGITNEGTSVFVEAETFVRQMRINFCLFVLRIIARNIVVFLNNLIVALCVIVICGKFSLSTLPLGILGILLVFYQGVWIVPLLGIIGTRFRDLQPLIQSVLLVLFLVTPIFWLPELLGPRQFIAELNPLTHFIEVARKPLLGEIPSWHSYLVVLATSVIGTLFAAKLYRKFRNRLVYWL